MILGRLSHKTKHCNINSYRAPEARLPAFYYGFIQKIRPITISIFIRQTGQKEMQK